MIDQYSMFLDLDPGQDQDQGKRKMTDEEIQPQDQDLVTGKLDCINPV